MDFGFSHCYHLHLSMLPWHTGSFAERMDLACKMMRKAGATSFRPHVQWNRIEPVITRPPLRVQDVSEKMVAEYAEGKTGIYWQETDIMVNSMTSNGLNPFLCLAAAYQHQVPLAEVNGRIVRMDDGPISNDHYLGQVYLHARAVVRRYKQQCNRWQLENELSGATSQLWPWRWRKGHRWRSMKFKDALFEVLYKAVKEEDPQARTSHNFCFDVSTLPGLYDWRKYIKRWHAYTDIIGFDPFPNYLSGQPIAIRTQMRRAAAQIRSLGLNKPLYILEDGIPVKPARQGFSEENQTAYIKEQLDAAEEEKMDGVFYYCFSSQEGAPGNEWHKTLFIHVIEDWWGLVRADGSTRPAYDYLVKRNQH